MNAAGGSSVECAGRRRRPGDGPGGARLRRYALKSALLHALVLGVLLALGTAMRLKVSLLPKGVVGGEGKTVALGRVPVRRVAPDAESERQQEERERHRPKIITRREFVPHEVAVLVPEELPADLRFDTQDQELLSPSLLETAGIAGAAAGESRPGVPDGVGAPTCLYPYQVRYQGGDWNPDPMALPALMREFTARTRIPASGNVQVVYMGNLRAAAAHPPPFLYVTGHGGIELSEAELQNLRAYLLGGGLLIVDDCGAVGWDFDSAVRRVFAGLFPSARLRRIPMGHRVYRAYYPITRVQGGNVRVCDYHEGLFLGGRLAVFYTRNDLGCAWEKRPDGKAVHPCQPGGEEQREWAYRMGVNLLVYAITAGGAPARERAIPAAAESAASATAY